MAHAHQHFGAERVFMGKKLEPSGDMNITPMIDVLLVLLVIKKNFPIQIICEKGQGS
jgi:hypothetical protein